MSGEEIDLYALLDKSVCSSEVHFGSLYALLHAILKQLQPERAISVSSPTSSAGSPGNEQRRLRSGVLVEEEAQEILQEASNAQPDTGVSSVSSGLQQQSNDKRSQTPPGLPPSRQAISPECPPVRYESLTDSIKLMERMNKLQALFEEQDKDLRYQLTEQRVLIDSLTSDREKLDVLEKMVTSLQSPESASASVDPDNNVYHELIQQISSVRKSVQKLEEDQKQLKAKQASTQESSTNRNLQDQLDKLRCRLNDLSCQCNHHEQPQDTANSQSTQQQTSGRELSEQSNKTKEELEAPGHDPLEFVNSSPEDTETQLACDASSSPSGLQQQSHKSVQTPAGLASSPCENTETLSGLRILFERVNKLEALYTTLRDGKVESSQLIRLEQMIEEKGITKVSEDRTDQERTSVNGQKNEQENLGPVNDPQEAIQQLQADCQILHEDKIQMQSNIEELFRAIEELEQRKADMMLVERAIKADKASLDSMVSRLQFDCVTEQLNALFHELLNKVSGQEEDWHRVISRLSDEMEHKLNQVEFDSVKEQLEGRWRIIHQKLKDQEAPELDSAAALKMKLADTFHCLSCDRQINRNFSQSMMALRYPYTMSVTAPQQFPSQNRSECITKITKRSYPAVQRSCGWKGTIITRRMMFSNLKKMTDSRARARESLHLQSEQVDILDLDICADKDGLDRPVGRKTETKRPLSSAIDSKLCSTPHCSSSSTTQCQEHPGQPL